jgi:hypothetical protein
MYLGPVWDCSTPHFTALLQVCPTKHLQLPKLYSSKKVEFYTNSTFFAEHLKRYSRNPSFEPPHGVVIILPTTVLLT